MAKTSIQWADHSINPFRARNFETGAVGHFCVKISGGCKFCYASKMQNPYLTQLEYTAENRSKVELFLEDKALDEVLRRRKPTRYFWCDMTDMFLDDYPDEWIDRCFTVMALTPHHTHLVLTKRAERMREWATDSGNENYESMRDRMDDAAARYFEACHANMNPPERWPLTNVHMGVSVEDQQHADERIGHLLATPAAVRWVSYEPALGAVNFASVLVDDCIHANVLIRWSEHPFGSMLTPDARIDWVVVGGESGPSARPFDIAWARSVIAQCKAARVPVFVKQLGAVPMYPPETILHPPQSRVIRLKDRKGGDMAEWPIDLQVREMPIGKGAKP